MGTVGLSVNVATPKRQRATAERQTKVEAMNNEDRQQEAKDREDREKADALARSQTDPLYLQDHFLFGGRNKDTKNATATFVQFEG